MRPVLLYTLPHDFLGVIYAIVLLLSNCDIIIVFIIRLLSLTFYRRAVIFSR
nr:MAG TPA: hypothetical protein [Caudoviricetes sp.]DAU94431.1 MAG TPA: hypothetical protein [Caudoviricetes sp.]DAW86330.1 MAG TPA: hypothetical protein [Caudoviricetes sp.]DAW94072.1 MAG TPA: hypothetical protein [Caudoviricetes sp.]